MEEGTLVRWFKQEGDTVEVGEVVFLVETEKTSMEVESTVSGKIARILFPEGATIKAGSAVALVVSEGEELPSGIPIPAVVESVPVISTSGGVSEKVTNAGQPSLPAAQDHIRASPAARRLMRERFIDPSLVQGTGPSGAITSDDVNRLLVASKDFKIVSVGELTGRRLATARKLSQTGIVPVTLVCECDATWLLQTKSSYVGGGEEPSLTELIIPCVAKALKAHPRVNSLFENGKLRTVENINIGVAMDAPEGLIVPVIKNADRLSLAEIMSITRTLRDKTKAERLLPQDLEMGTFTITNLGMFGVGLFTPVINPPQVAILGVGLVTESPVSRNGKIESVKRLALCVTFDHRVMDGVEAARFLQSVKSSIENPEIDK